MSLTPKTIDHRNPEYVRLLDQRDTKKALQEANLALIAAEGEILASKRAMDSFERRFRNLQAGSTLLVLLCLVAIAVEATVIVVLLTK